MQDLLTMRKASVDDCDFLIRLRIDFMKVMGPLSAEQEATLLSSLTTYVKPALESGRLVAWLYEDSAGTVVSNGWLCYIQKVPHPGNPSGLEGYILNVHTIDSWRRKGLASNVIRKLVEEAKSSPARVVKLIASDYGRPVYEKLGFVPEADSMKLYL